MVLVYTFTIFLSAALMFMVQPMIGKMILPTLGGAPAVWNTCLVFFQALLLGGYLYAHFSIKWLGHRVQSIVHIGVLAATLCWLVWRWVQNAGTPFSIPTDQRIFADTTQDPTMQLLVLLVTMIGLPFFVISTSAPLLQSWFSKTDHPNASNPFFLYAASNLGSMISLITYPFLINKYFSLTEQGQIWTQGFAGLVVGCILCAAILWNRSSSQVANLAEQTSAPKSQGASYSSVMIWIVLSFIPSSLLIGETTFLASEVLSHPLLWVMTLALYLLTFIIVFSDKPIISHALALRMTPLATILLVIVVAGKSNEPTWLVVGVHIVSFFLLALICHGELAKRKPEASQLTSYYLWMSFGGVLGGSFNSILAPVLFKYLGLVEYPLGLIASLLVLGIAGGSLRKAGDWVFAGGVAAIATVLLFVLPRDEAILSNLIYGIPAILLLPIARNLPKFALGAAALILVGALDSGVNGRTLFLERNFYGVLKVTYDPTRNANLIIHGNTLHSIQSRDPADALFPTGYFYSDGPMSTVFDHAVARNYGQIAVAGLGAGGVACFAHAGQHWTFYEIDPAMKRVAEDPEYFTFLKECYPEGGATYEVKLGDARMELAMEPSEKFDLIVLNAFSSSSPPLHLLTEEAVGVYLSKLKPDGILAFNASNRHLELEPALAAIAKSKGLAFRNAKDVIKSVEEKKRGKMNSSIVLMARSEDLLAPFSSDSQWSGMPDKLPRVWTDQYTDILGSMKW
ncbi:MAG: fused MFS/spermidine synthase [Pirellula sp.]|nr:fused MFS/spermidine synthase [Pirellula sp.]